MKRFIIALLAFVALALPASAEQSGTITWLEDTPGISERHGESPRVAIVGSFLVVVLEDGTEYSYEVPADAVTFTVADDGSVGWVHGEKESYEAPADETYDFGPLPTEPEPEEVAAEPPVVVEETTPPPSVADDTAPVIAPAATHQEALTLVQWVMGLVRAVLGI